MIDEVHQDTMEAEVVSSYVFMIVHALRDFFI